MSLFDSIGKGLPSITNFAVASVTQKAAELGDKLVKTGMNALFGSSISPSSIVNIDVAAELKNLHALQAQQSIPASLMANATSTGTAQFKVVITQSPEVGDLNQLVFDVMPKIDESRSVDYESISPIHHPGVILKYRSTGVRSWSVNGRLISRTSAEATKNLAIVNMIRSWTEPWYGEGTARSMSSLLGAPPPILTLTAYGSRAIGPVKCVLKSYNTPWDNAIDYIPTASGEPFPVIMEITLALEESFSPAEYSGFDLIKYKQGDLSSTGAFNQAIATYSPSGPIVGGTHVAVGGGPGGATADEFNKYLASRTSTQKLEGAIATAKAQAPQQAKLKAAGMTGTLPTDTNQSAVIYRVGKKHAG